MHELLWQRKQTACCRSPQKHNNQMKTYVTSSGRHIASGFDLLRLFTHETRAHRRISCFLKTRYTRDVTASRCLEQPETTSDKTHTKREIIFRDYSFLRRPQDFRLEKCWHRSLHQGEIKYRHSMTWWRHQKLSVLSHSKTGFLWPVVIDIRR